MHHAAGHEKRGLPRKAIPKFSSITESRLSDFNLLGLLLCLASARKHDMKHTVNNLCLNLIFLHIVRQRQSLLVIAV